MTFVTEISTEEPPLFELEKGMPLKDFSEIIDKIKPKLGLESSTKSSKPIYPEIRFDEEGSMIEPPLLEPEKRTRLKKFSDIIEKIKPKLRLESSASPFEESIYPEIKFDEEGSMIEPPLFELEKRILLKGFSAILEKIKSKLRLESSPKSETTRKYFEDWDALHLDANPEIKETMRKNILIAEKQHQKIYEQAAREAGVSIEVFKKKLQEKVERAVENSNFFRATKISVLDKVLNGDGRFKSQFETHDSGGFLNPSFRALAEMKMFGFNMPPGGFKFSTAGYHGSKIPDSIVHDNCERRPIYGYFSDNEHGEINERGTNPPSNNLVQYGEITVKLKRDRALEKATLSFQDSLDYKDCPPTPAIKPHFTSLEIGDAYSDVILDRVENPGTTKWGSVYTEAQFHGGLTLDDIDVIYVSTGNRLYDDQIIEVREIYNRFIQSHPDSDIKLIEY